MEINPSFNKYMDHYFDYRGHWDSPSRCGMKIIRCSDGRVVAIATELYRQNPGSPVTECVGSIATKLLAEHACAPEHLIFIEHTPDVGSKLDFYDETFDRVMFEWDGSGFTQPRWIRLTFSEVDELIARCI